MKKVAIIISLISVPFLATAQSIFDKYEDMDQVGSVVVNQKMFEIKTTSNGRRPQIL